MPEVSLPNILKFTNILGAAGIIFVAIYRLIIDDTSKSNEGVLSMYLVLFSLLLVSTEFNAFYIGPLFGFLYGQIGKGFFIVFCGSLFLSKRFNVIVVIGGILIALGLINILLFPWIKSKEVPPPVNTKAQEPQSQQGNQEPKKKTPKNKSKNKSGTQELSQVRGNTNIQINFEVPNPNQNQEGPRLMVL